MKYRKIIIIKIIISYILYYSGFIWFYNKIRSIFYLSEIKILAYHNISYDYPKFLSLSQPPNLFESQLKYLLNHYEIISLENALNMLKNKKRLKKDKIVLTFDDNYKEYYTHLFALKKKYNFDFTIFAAVDPLESKKLLFVDGLVYAIGLSNRETLDMRQSGLDNYCINTHKDKQNTISTINKYSQKLSTSDRKKLLCSIYDALGIDKNDFAKFTLTWNELSEMADKGVSIGAHTLSHPKLTAVSDKEAEQEIVQSKKIIAQKINRKVDFFAYPYGTDQSYNQKVENIVKKAGFVCACTLNKKESLKNLFALKRINIDSSACSYMDRHFFKSMFALKLSGLYDSIFFTHIKSCLSRLNINR